ncbi:MAG: hypothetical protein JO004_04645 [Methylobacteriaceae bacterium]|nr:hypothetical protein [Methylobacteriaceae bacterium]
MLSGQKRRFGSKLETHALYVLPRDFGSGDPANKSHERHVTKLIRRDLKRGDVFLDIAANLGFFTTLA